MQVLEPRINRHIHKHECKPKIQTSNKLSPKLICLEQSLCQYRSTSSDTSSSLKSSPRTSFLFLAASSVNFSTSPSTGAQVPVHFRSSRPGPKGENFGVSRNAMGLTELLVSEYEYLKSKGRSDFSGKGSEIWVF